MRRTVLILIVCYFALFCWGFWSTEHGSFDAAGRGMAMGFLMIGATITALFTIPAAILVGLDRAPKLALALAIAPGAIWLMLTIGNL